MLNNRWFFCFLILMNAPVYGIQQYYSPPTGKKIPLGPKLYKQFIAAVSTGDVATVSDMLEQDDDYGWPNFDESKIEALQIAADKFKQTKKKIADMMAKNVSSKSLAQLKQQQKNYYEIVWKVGQSTYNAPSSLYEKLKKDQDVAAALEGVIFKAK